MTLIFNIILGGAGKMEKVLSVTPSGIIAENLKCINPTTIKKIHDALKQFNNSMEVKQIISKIKDLSQDRFVGTLSSDEIKAFLSNTNIVSLLSKIIDSLVIVNSKEFDCLMKLSQITCGHNIFSVLKKNFGDITRYNNIINLHSNNIKKTLKFMIDRYSHVHNKCGLKPDTMKLYWDLHKLLPYNKECDACDVCDVCDDEYFIKPIKWKTLSIILGILCFIFIIVIIYLSTKENCCDY